MVTANSEITLFYSGVFSQWHPSKFVIRGVTFTHAEQWMMFGKALVFGDFETAKDIMEAKTPYIQKQLGRKVKNYVDSEWCKYAKDIVYWGNLAKFTQNPDLLTHLLATGDTDLAEASPKDKRWGIGLKESDPKALDRKQWRGDNWLGNALTYVREDILALHITPVAEWMIDLMNIYEGKSHETESSTDEGGACSSYTAIP